ncbi:MAG: glycosyltransferase family 39 protein [Bacteroidetes bacterium]|nr:glycosyltransferase family 39 protein [Bacteroidota bacterium]MCL5024971.1 glycosyltransferase family 39 protein [Chloroflexota bacterium]
MKAKTRVDWALAGALTITFAAFALRAFQLAGQSLWSDEIFVVRFTALPLADMLPALARSEPHPPLYYTLVHFWRLTAGSGEEALRYPSLFFSVLCIPAIYLLGRSLLGGTAGLLAALILAINPFQVWYAQEARMYTMPVAGTLLAAYLLYRALRDDRWRWWLGYFLAAVLGLGAHYYAFLALAAINGVALWPIGRRPRLLRGWLAANAAVASLTALWFLYIWRILTAYPGWMQKTTLPEILWRSTVAFSMGTSFPPEYVHAAGLAFAAFFIVSAAIAIWRPPRGYQAPILFLTYGLLPLVGAYALQELLHRPIYHERYVIVAAPAIYLMIGAALARARRWWWMASAALLAGVVAVSSFSVYNHFFNAAFAKGEMRELARYMEARAGQSDVVLAVEARDQIYEYYARRPLPRVPVGDMPTLQRDLPRLLERYERIWFLPYFNLETDIYPEQWLSQHAYLVEQRWFNNGRLLWYSRPVEPVVVAPRTAAFGDGLALEGAGLSPATLEPGQVVHLSLRWAADRQQTADLKLSLRLMDGKGRVFAQTDRELADRFRPAASWPPGQPVVGNHGLAVPVDAPPGTYRLQALVYSPAGGGPITYIESSTRGTEVALGQVNVSPPTRAWSPLAAGLPEQEVARFGQVARLLAYDLPPRSYTAGDTVPLTLRWQALEPEGRDYREMLQIVGPGGQVVGELTKPPVDGTFPISRWQPGQLVRDMQDVRLPRSLPGGEYTIRLGLVPAEGEAGPVGTATLGKVEVQARAASFEVPAMQHERHAVLGEAAELLGYDLEPAEAGGGESLRLTLYWRALGDVEESYKVFVHLVGPDGQLLAQHDSFPCNDRCPTQQWMKGEVLCDEHRITLKPVTPPGSYTLLAGMYDPQSGQRLPSEGEAARGAERSIEVSTVQVR